MVSCLFTAGTSRGWFGFSSILLAAGLASAFLTLVVSPTRAQTTGAQTTGAQTTETQVTSADSLSREAGAPPYPILFVHGLASSADVWKESQEGLSVFGRLRSRWGEAQQFRVNLNADNNDEECSLSEDVRFGTESLSDGNLFAMDFDYDQAGSPYSDESAIVKQGKALSRAISEVLMATGEEKVVLVGHSMGGLAIREYLQRRGPGGEPRWWVDSGLESGHRVARVVTVGTPHYGTNTDFADIVSPFSKSEADTARTQGQVPAFPFNSEAIRDLRRSYEYPSSEEQGRYLYGGREGWPVSSLTGWSNTDVNCDGTEDDVITGINEVGLSSLEMPLPKDISYTWVTSDCTGGPNLVQQCSDAGPKGDGVVKLANQYLKTESGGSYPGGISDTLLISKYHTYETGDVTGILRGIDEPGRRDLAYSLPTDQPEGTYIDGYFTAPPIDTSGSFVFTDFDAYRPEGVRTGSITVTIPSPSLEFSSVSVTENGLLAGGALLGEAGEPARFTVSTAGMEEHTVYVEGLLLGAREVEAYSVRADTRSLRHFTYQPRHGSFADTTQQGFASLRVPESVPEVGGEPLSEGDEIGVFTPGGTCVGAAVWVGAPTYVSAFGNRQGGLREGDSLRVRIWDRSTQTEYATAGTLSGDGRYEPGKTLVAKQLSADLGPPAPNGLLAEASSENVKLEWESPPGSAGGPGVSRYRIYRSVRPIQPGQTGRDDSASPDLLGSTSSTSFTDTTSLPRPAYRYRVSAVGPDGNESALSNEARAVPGEVLASDTTRVGEEGGPVPLSDRVGASVRLAGVGQPGKIAATGLEGRPEDTEGISQLKVSPRRIVLEAREGLAFDSAEVRVAKTAFEGAAELSDVSAYRRDTLGVGRFQEIRARIDRAGTPAEPKDDTLVAVARGFSEFAFGVGDRPPEPTGLAAEVRGGTVGLSWKAVSDPGVESYRIYRGTSPIGSSAGPGGQAPLGSVEAGAAQYTDTTGVPGTTYFYRVTAVDAGGSESGFSGEASATPRDAEPPSAPASLAAQPDTTGRGRVSLRWSPPETADLASHRVYRSAASFSVPSEASQVASLSAADSAYVDTAATAGETYHYRVAAVDTASNRSDLSGEAVATPEDRAPPPVPKALAATVEGDGPGSAVRLSWEGVSERESGGDLAGYRLYRSAESLPEASGAPLSERLIAGSAFTDTTAEVGEAYRYAVTSVDTAGNESALSGVASAYLQPEAVEASVARSFGEASGPGDYRLVALPGAPDTSLAASISGEAGAEWQAYRESGDDLKRYDGSEEDFSFQKGRGYWLTSRQEWTLEGRVKSAPLQDSTTSVPLNPGGWTIVANPFGEAVSFGALNRANGGDLEALWPFGGAFSDTSAVFKSARQGQAYYLFSEDPSRDSLQVPHPALTDGSRAGSSGTRALQAASAKAASAKAAASATIVLSARPAGAGEGGPGAASTVRVGLAEGKEPGTLRAPPGGLEAVSLRVVRGGQKAGEQGEEKRLLMADRRRAEGEGETFRLRLESQVEGPIQVQARGADSLGRRSAALIDRSGQETYDLSRDGPIQIRPGEEKRRLEVAIGTGGYVESKRKKVLPEAVTLTSYPNPTRRQATIEYTLPEAGDVTLQVYDVLGRQVATLAEGRKQAGRHTARLETGRLPSGVYFGRLEAGGETRTQKITVVR